MIFLGRTFSGFALLIVFVYWQLGKVDSLKGRWMVGRGKKWWWEVGEKGKNRVGDGIEGERDGREGSGKTKGENWCYIWWEMGLLSTLGLVLLTAMVAGCSLNEYSSFVGRGFLARTSYTAGNPDKTFISRIKCWNRIILNPDKAFISQIKCWNRIILNPDKTLISRIKCWNRIILNIKKHFLLLIFIHSVYSYWFISDI